MSWTVFHFEQILLPQNQQPNQAASSGNLKAQFHLGSIYFFGEYIERDYLKAAKWFLLGAEQGDPICAFNIGVMYNSGLGVPKNLKESIRWLLQAERGSDNVAETINEIIAENTNEAILLLKEHAESGNPLSQYYLSVAYQRTGPSNVKLVAHWALQAAEQGHAQAMNNLGCLLIAGQGIKKNVGMAVQWLKRASKAGNADAMYSLGLLYYRGKLIDRDYRKAFKYLHQAAKNGDKMAAYRVGIMYMKGMGVMPSGEEALFWLSCAGHSGLSRALFVEAKLLSEGILIPPNEKLAFIRFFQAAQMGYWKAFRPLADLYYEGRGEEKDLEEARRFYKKAVASGDEIARKRLEELSVIRTSKEGTVAVGELKSILHEDELFRSADEGDEESRKQLLSRIVTRWANVLDKISPSL